MSKIIFSKENAKDFANVSKAASTKSTLAALEGILIECKDGKVTLTGYDLTKGINCEITPISASSEEVKILLPADKVASIVKSLSSDNFTFSISEKNVTVSGGAAKFRLPLLNADDYPELPSFYGSEECSVPQQIFRTLVDKVLPFASPEGGNRPLYEGVHFEVSEDKLRAVALDGFRVAVATSNCNSNIDVLDNVNIPTRIVSLATKFCGNDNDNVTIQKSKNMISVIVDNYRFFGPTVAGKWMDYKAAIPDKFSSVFVADTAKLRESMERINILNTDKIKVPTIFTFSQNSVNVSSVNTIGTAEETIDGEYAGNQLTVGFQNRYYTDTLKLIDTEKVEINLNSPISPCIIKPKSEDELSVDQKYLILPCRIKS